MMRLHLRNLFLAAGIVPLLVLSVKADRYVAQAGQMPGGGYTGWNNAASNIHEAVAAAAAGETVWVSNGWYRTPSTITITRTLQLCAAADNDAVIIDGQGAQRILAVSISQPLTVLLEGLVLTNGYNTSAGAGIRVDHSADVAATVTVRDCVITHCRGAAGAFDSKGGAIRIQGRTDSNGLFVHLDHCEILHSFATSRAGGIKIIDARFLMEDCHIAYNQTSAWDPFAVPALNESSPRWGGGIFVQNAGPDSIIRNCVVEHNRVNAYGGGIAVRRNGFLLENCIVRDNLAGLGGGVHIDSTLLNGVEPMIIRNCLIHGNVTQTNAALTTTSFSNGGGVNLGLHPQSFVDAVKNVWIQNSTIVSNKAAGQAGGIYTSGGRDNRDPPEGDLDTILLNTIVYGNVAVGTPARSNVYFTLSGPSTYWVTNCLVGTDTVLPGSGNMTTKNPEFVDFSDSDYHLTLASPCRNSGYYLSWMDTARDLDGKPRIQPISGVVDIGCYEYQPTGFVITIR